MTEQSLKDKTVKGVGWSAADAFLGQGVTFIVGLVLARLLSPEEYGLIGIVTIFTTVLLGFVDCGFSNALIRKQEVNDEDYSTLFILNTVTSLFLCGLLFLAAPTIAIFFDRPQLVSLIRVMGLILIFQALSIVQMTILSRNVDFKTKTKASVISAVCSGIIGVGMALLGFGVWSLVAQQLSLRLLYSISLWLFNKWIPKLRFCAESFTYMWGFGWKLMVSGMIERIWQQLNQAVVGKYYSPASLGQFSRAKEYSTIVTSNFSSIIQRVTFPVLAQLQDNKERLVEAYRRIIKTTMFATVVVTIFLGAVSEPLIYCMIGAQWLEAATYLPLLCLSMSFYPLHAINLSMLQIQNRTDIYLYLEIIKKVIGVVPIVIGVFVSIYWMLIAMLLESFISFFLNSYYSGKELKYTCWMQLSDIAPSYGVALIVALSVYFLKYLPFSNWVILPIQLIVGASAFFLICETTQLNEYEEVKGVASEYFKKIRVKYGE